MQEKKISNDCINIVVKSTDGNIVFDCQTKTHDSCVAGVEFLHEINDESTQSAMTPCKKNIDHHVTLHHPSESIPRATTRALDIQVTGTFMTCKDCTLGNAKQ